MTQPRIRDINVMNIFSKLLLVLLFTSSILLSIIYLVVQWSFDRGMLEYVNQKELQSLQLLNDNLAKYYQQSHNWQSLLQHINALKKQQVNQLQPSSKNRIIKHKRVNPNTLWHQILVLSNDEHIFPEDVHSYLIENAIIDKRFKNKIHSRNNRNAKRLPPKRQQPGMLLPTLLNSNKEVIIGRFDKKFSLKAITLQGEIIGFIALAPKKHLSDAFDLSFIQQSKQNFIFTFLLLFILLAIIAVLLSRHFVTPIKYLERQIRLLNKGEYQVRINVKGKDELALLSLNFNDLAQTLEQNKKSRNTWLANISHELRTPVAIIKAEIEAMQDGIRTLNIEALASLAEEINHLQKLIEDISTLSNAEIGAMRYQKHSINFSTLLDTNLARHQVKAQSINMQLSVNISAKKTNIWADETRINQLIDNVMNNCFKYTKAPGNIIVSLRTEKNRAILTIDDSFPSVPTADLTKLFDHLYRVENSRNRKTGGSGIGLSLCKNIATAHQGTISASNSSHGGISICFTLPLVK